MRNPSTPVEAWNRFYRIADAQVDAEFERLKARRLEALQTEIRNSSSEIRGRTCARSAGFRVSDFEFRPSPTPVRLLWLGVMFAAIAVVIWKLAGKL